MIISRELIRSIGFDSHVTDMTIHWNNATILWRDMDSTTNDAFALSQHNAPFNSERKGMKRIFDAKYSQADIKTITESSTDLDLQEINELYTLLNKYEWLFNVNLGTWYVKPYDIKLKPDAEPLWKTFFLFHAYMNSRSNKNSIDSSILRS